MPLLSRVLGHARLRSSEDAVVVLPQRQVALVAKQAASVDVLSGDGGVDVWVSLGESTPAGWTREVAAWKEMGASHLTLNTAFHVGHHRRIDGTLLADHVNAISRYMETVADLL